MQLGPRFTDALRLANELHAGQTRKASQVPYLSHVLSVGATVLEYGGDEDVAIAALLHDVVEDCGGMKTAELVRARFGDRVLRIVLGCSDTTELSKPPWQDRKERYLAHLPHSGPEVLLVSAADKLHNLQSLLREEQRLGPALWSYFRAGREGTLWYYEELLKIFQRSSLPVELIEQLSNLVGLLRTRINLQRVAESAREPSPCSAESGPSPPPSGRVCPKSGRRTG